MAANVASFHGRFSGKKGAIRGVSLALSEWKISGIFNKVLRSHVLVTSTALERGALIDPPVVAHVCMQAVYVSQ
jgi:hypothetical protein